MVCNLLQHKFIANSDSNNVVGAVSLDGLHHSISLACIRCVVLLNHINASENLHFDLELSNRL